MQLLNEITSVHWQPSLTEIGAVVERVADIEQCIKIILTSPKGCDPHRPDFACDIARYLDWPLKRATPYIVREVVEALRKFEPRIVVGRITPIADAETGARLTVKITYRLADEVATEFTRITEVRL